MLVLSEILPDGGPLYAETDLHSYIVEPFNAVSSLAYLLPALYWLVRIRTNFRKYYFLAFCLPLVMLGGIGSTLYHAFRSSPILLFMDVFPIALVTFMVSIYFWVKVLPKWWHIFFILIPFMAFRYLIFKFLSSSEGMGWGMERQTTINISYFLSGVMIFLPAILLSIKEKFLNYAPLAMSCVLFILGLLFREVDSWEPRILFMGTHWLWHISTAAGTWFLGEYLYRQRSGELEKAHAV